MNRNGRTNTYSVWSTTLASGEKIQTAVEIYGENVYVRVVIEGVEHVRKGVLTVERVLTEGPRERLIEKLTKATVSSLLGDVKGTDRTIIGAAEAYGSAVAKELVRQRDAERVAAALTVDAEHTFAPGDTVRVESLGSAFDGLKGEVVSAGGDSANVAFPGETVRMNFGARELRHYAPEWTR